MSIKIDKKQLFSKAFWKSPQGQKTFCLVGLLLSILFLLSQFGGSLADLFPGSGSRDVLERELKKLQQEQIQLESELAAAEAVQKQAEMKLTQAWKAAQYGEPEIELRALIEKRAKDMDLRFNNISTVRRSSFNKDMSLLELDMTVNTDLATLTEFWLAVDKLEPVLYWKRFECRLHNVYGVSMIQFNGTLRCANDDNSHAPPPAETYESNSVEGADVEPANVSAAEDSGSMENKQ